jgi:tryptophan 2,3-dioxygenase
MTADSFAPRPDRQAPTTYETYLRTDELLSLQKPPEQRLHPDELTFQVVHQTFELWWKITVDELRAAATWLRQSRANEAAHALRRSVSAGGVLMAAMRQLEYVSPKDFLVIRAGLGNGSGGESPGFRAILRTVPDVWDSFVFALKEAGITLVDLYLEPGKHPELYECAEELTDFDEQFHLFRAAHLKLAQRHLGLRAVGTGGTPMPSLEKTLHDLFFPELWEARDELLSRVTSSPDGADSSSESIKR